MFLENFCNRDYSITGSVFRTHNSSILVEIHCLPLTPSPPNSLNGFPSLGPSVKTTPSRKRRCDVPEGSLKFCRDRTLLIVRLTPFFLFKVLSSEDGALGCEPVWTVNVISSKLDRKRSVRVPDEFGRPWYGRECLTGNGSRTMCHPWVIDHYFTRLLLFYLLVRLCTYLDVTLRTTSIFALVLI